MLGSLSKKLIDQEFMDVIGSSCPRLKKLALTVSRGQNTIRLSSSSLRKFLLLQSWRARDVAQPCFVKVDISFPKLRSLHLGVLYVDEASISESLKGTNSKILIYSKMITLNKFQDYLFWRMYILNPYLLLFLNFYLGDRSFLIFQVCHFLRWREYSMQMSQGGYTARPKIQSPKRKQNCLDNF